MHVLSITIREIAMQLNSAKPDPAFWHGDSARAFAASLDSLIHDLTALANQLGA
jgi:uncharacterized protein YukE